MKVTSNEQYLFQPIKITLTLENEQDLRAFFELGNVDAIHFVELLNQSEELTENSISASFTPLFTELKKYYGL